jgi:hypothetical protein
MATSIKLSVTVRSALERKYPAAALKKIDRALAAWQRAEKARGIVTVHVALDRAADLAAHGVAPLDGRVTAARAKRAIDALAAKLAPDYIVLIGGHDVVPHFELPNPIFEPGPDGDPDRTVPSDNPYACTRPFRAGDPKSYLVPDRVVGRLPDLPAADGQGDPATLLAALRTATRWQPHPAAHFGTAYATCTATWSPAGRALMKYLEQPTADLMVSPPVTDTSALARRRLGRPIHVIKCHGADLDAHFYGEAVRGTPKFPEVLASPTLAGRVAPGALAAAVCCYGASVYAPDAPDAIPRGVLPVPVAYLHAGALAFMGSTKIAYVGPRTMLCADWIVGSYIKRALAGASLGRALLESKQEYMRWLQGQGQPPDAADEKTMIEFVLLGDPAIHPVASTVPLPARIGPAGATRRATLRAERRVARAAVAAEVRRELPTRAAADAPPAREAQRLFREGVALLDDAPVGVLDPARARASRVLPPRSAANGAVRAAPRGEAMEYTWSARLPDARGGPASRQPRVVVLSVQTDGGGRVVRSRTLYGT